MQNYMILFHIHSSRIIKKVVTQVIAFRHTLWVVFKRMRDAEPNAIAIDKSLSVLTNLGEDQIK